MTGTTSYVNAVQLSDRISLNKAITAFRRVQEMKPCPFGQGGVCCRACFMEPCRVSEDNPKRATGVCGATAPSIAAKNFGRMIAADASAHSDHGREVAKLFLEAARGEAPGYEIRDERKLHMLAGVLGLEMDGKGKNEPAIEVEERLLEDFGQQEGQVALTARAPERRQELWRRRGIVPRGIDREIVEMMHRTSVGEDQDHEHIILHGSRTALADGWGGSMIATELQDILFGTPVPLRVKVNLGALREDQVDTIIHGHEPLLPEMIVVAAQDQELLALAREKGAQGINIAGICCTANEILMRHGVPVAGSFLQQELALMTGAVDVMAVDVQCVMPSVPTVARCSHTEVVTTSEKAKVPGAAHMPFNSGKALEQAKEVIRLAIENFPNRGSVDTPEVAVDMVAGFSHETINYIQGGKVPGLISPPERQHHERPYQRCCGRGGVQQPPGALWLCPRHPDQGVHRQQHPGADDGLRCYHGREGGAVDPRGGRARRLGTSRGPRGSGNASGPPHGFLCGQLPPPHRRHADGA